MEGVTNINGKKSKSRPAKKGGFNGRICLTNARNRHIFGDLERLTVELDGFYEFSIP